jgi:hypothetical protein
VAAGELKSAGQRDITATEAKATAKEMFLCGGDTHFNPISEWDDVQVLYTTSVLHCGPL